jgi:hypothetical protein
MGIKPSKATFRLAAFSSSDRASFIGIQGFSMADGKGASAIFCSRCDSAVFQKITLSHVRDTKTLFA